MAHEITATDRFGYVGAPAWHGLGQALPQGIGAVEAFERVGLGWYTTLAPLTAGVEGMGPDGSTCQPLAITEYRAHVRLDTRTVLGVVSKDYTPVENSDLAEFADALAGADAAVRIETAGSLRGGQRVFALVRLPQDIVLSSDDTVAPYVLISNGHGGCASFNCGPTMIRVVCANTMRLAESETRISARFRHSSGIADRVKAARVTLGYATRDLERFAATAKALADRKLTRAETKAYFLAAYTTEFGKRPEGADDVTLAKWDAKKLECLDQWWVNLVDARQQTAAAQGSAWGAFNAITQWHDHERGRASTTTEARVNSNLWGTSHRAKADALALAVSL